MTAQLPRRWPLYAIGAACLAIAFIAIRGAASWYGHPFAGAFVDTGGVVSNMGLPGWEGERQGLHFPDLVLAVDGQPLVSGPGTPRAHVWDRAIERAWNTDRTIDALVQTPTGVRTVRLPVSPLDPRAWWIYGGAPIFAAVLYVAAALIALWASPASALARTFAKLAIFSGLFNIALFDFHTTRGLVPIFFIAFAMVPMTWVALALRLPDDAPILRRFPFFEKVTEAIGAFVAIAFLALYWSGRETQSLQRIWTVVLGGGFLFLGVTFIVRFVRARDVRRARLRALLLSVVPPHLAMLAIIFPASQQSDFGASVDAIAYAALSLFPLATAYAFVRYDLWGSRALLSRILTRLAVGSVVCVIGIGLGTALAAQLGVPFAGALVAAGFGGVGSAVLVIAALGLTDRHVFASRIKYKPTVAQLSEELISITSPEEVARALQKTIRRWLRCDLIEVSLPAPKALEQANPIESIHSPQEPLSSGAEQIALPIEFGGARLGSLLVGEKRGSALFTDDDLDLLRTIVNQGALALAHAYAYQELETRRREQAHAWRGERAALVETVASEIAHEIRYPINFFRSVFDNAAGRPLDSEDIDIGREEVERLERLVSGLRKMAGNQLQRAPVRIAELCQRAETLLRDALGERGLERAVPDAAEVRCDPDQVMQVLVNLIANGLQAAGETGSVGIAWSQASKGAELIVWDTGPGFDGDPAKLFAPWYTTKPKGTGLGLAITHRIVRAHGWNVNATRRDNRTLFVVSIRAEDVVAPDGLDVHRESGERSSQGEGPHRRRSA